MTAPPQPVRYGGRCVTCGGAHALRPGGGALAAARALAARVAAEGRLDWDAPGPGDPRFAVAYLDGSKGPGRMLGVLVAKDPGRPPPWAPPPPWEAQLAAAAAAAAASGAALTGDPSIRVLKAFSGQITMDWDIPGWCPPVQSVTSGGGYYSAVRALTEDLSRRIERLSALQAAAVGAAATGQGGAGGAGAGARRRGAAGGGAASGGGGAAERFVASQLELLTARRKGVSHHLLQQIQRSYITRDCAGAPLSLLDAYLAAAARFGPLPLTRAGGFSGFPAGCGDCAAPKLLHAAAALGWAPLAMAEFYYGAPPRTATRAKPPARMARGGGGGRGAAAAGASRAHGEVYGACDKCRAVLGTMLHGAAAAGGGVDGGGGGRGGDGGGGGSDAWGPLNVFDGGEGAV
ncbi:MAG: hypothetical protein J3K34DRAFT_521590 [Monoraphidium minutum]|nr:MAG: hypothetical protein J3K34DRAFT_521590 [Monoraphidium minutum]